MSSIAELLEEKKKAPTIQEMLTQKQSAPDDPNYGDISGKTQRAWQQATAPAKPRRASSRPSIYGPSDVWTSPADSELWKGPGARFTKGIPKGAARSTQIPALIGKKIPPAETKAGRVGEITGSALESIIELLATGGAMKGLKMLPKGASFLTKAARTGMVFGGQEATSQARKAGIEAIHGEDAGYGGAAAVLGSFATGAILSMAVSGAGVLWHKLRPTEQVKMLKVLGLKEGATLEEINRATRLKAVQFHPDKVVGMREQFEKTVQARDYLREYMKTGGKDIVYKAGAKPPPAQLPASVKAEAKLAKALRKKAKISKPVAKKAAAMVHKEGKTVAEVDRNLITRAKVLGDTAALSEPPITPTEPTPIGITPAPEKILPAKPEITAPAQRPEAEKAPKPLPEQEVTTEKEKYTKPVQPPKPEISPAAAKEPWEMDAGRFEIITQPLRAALKRTGFTKAMAVELSYKEIEKTYPWIRQIPKQLKHKAIVKKALKEGKPVPAEVLAEYPDLSPVEGEVKKVWEMTFQEYKDFNINVFRESGLKGNPDIKRENHKNKIKYALSEGKPVPAEVLAEYPDLAPAEPAKTIKQMVQEKGVSPEKARRKGGIMPPEMPKKGEGEKWLTAENLKRYVTEGFEDARRTKGEMGIVELEAEARTKSNVVNKHIEYFGDIQLPDTSKIRPIQREMRRINGKRLSGKITAAEANKRIRALKSELFSTALKEGISIRTTKRGGKAVLSLRKAGTYVPEDFSKYTKFKDIQPLFGGGQDITRAIQQMDGSLSIKAKKAEKGQAGPLEKNVLWRTRDISRQKLEFVKEQSARLNSFLTVKRKSKNDTLVNNVLRQIKSGETLQDALKNKKVLAYTKDKKIINQAVKLRSWYDDMIDSQNALRQIRNQDEIPYRGKYSPEILRDATIWERVMMKDVKESYQIIKGVDLPDYIKPNKPFNPRELARDAGIKYEDRVKSATQLARNYLVTASKDIFNTSIIQNNKAFIQQLEAMDYKKSAGYLADWTAEAYAGVKPKLDRTIRIPKKIANQMRRFNQARNIAVFPLNFAWNLWTQPTSLAFTFSKYGTVKTFKGFIDWLSNTETRTKAAKDYYSYIVKTHKAGKVTRQDAMNLIGENINIKKTKGETVYDIANLVGNEMERLVTGTSIQAAYRHGKAKGLTGKALQEFASDGGGKTQSMYNDEDRPAILRTLGAKTLTPYQTFHFEAMNNLREWMGRTGTPPDNNRERTMQLIRFIAAAAVFRMIAKKMANRDIYTWDRMPMPFAEYWFSPIAKKITGKPHNLEYSLPSPIAVGYRIAGGMYDVWKTGSWQRLRRELLKYGTGYLHIPGGVQINRTVDALIAYSRGGVYDRSGKKMFDVEKDELKKAIFSGVYSTKGGKKYLEKKEGAKEEKEGDYPPDF